MTRLKTTPLHAEHERAGARMVDFAGFDMPVDFGSILDEHRAVRERAGLFDVSHMGQLYIQGSGATATVERLVTCPVASLANGQVRYGLLCNPEGGVVDDVTVYRIADDSLMLCVNAANIAKDHEWVKANLQDDTYLDDRSDKTGLLAIQGPRAAAILSSVCESPSPETLRRFRFGPFEIAQHNALISRTGYTGSDGFEIYLAADSAVPVYEALLEKGAGEGLQSAGLGARDTLRLEAALPLYGHELDDSTSPLEAGLDRFVKREAGGFIGAEAIEERAAAGASRKLVGLEVSGRRIARAGDIVLSKENEVGTVTSGAPSPTLGHPIALAYVSPDLAAPETVLDVAVRGGTTEVRVVATPFVRGGAAAAKR